MKMAALTKGSLGMEGFTVMESSSGKMDLNIEGTI